VSTTRGALSSRFLLRRQRVFEPRGGRFRFSPPRGCAHFSLPVIPPDISLLLSYRAPTSRARTLHARTVYTMFHLDPNLFLPFSWGLYLTVLNCLSLLNRLWGTVHGPKNIARSSNGHAGFESPAAPSRDTVQFFWAVFFSTLIIWKQLSQLFVAALPSPVKFLEYYRFLPSRAHSPAGTIDMHYIFGHPTRAGARRTAVKAYPVCFYFCLTAGGLGVQVRPQHMYIPE
jgi:hypothetical protein